jgi:hypothetical protein
LAVVVVVLRLVVVVVAGTVVVVVAVALEMINADISSTVVCDGGAGVTPLGSKAKVTRRYCPNLIEPGLVVMVGVVCESELQYAYSTTPV